MEVVLLSIIFGLVTESCWAESIVSGRGMMKHNQRQDLNLQWKKAELLNKGFDVTSIPGRAVKYFSTKKNWDTAKSACHDLGGYLLTVDSDSVTKWVKKTSDVFWIGLNDKATNGRMVWDSGLPFSYKKWHSGATFDDGGNEDCVGVNIKKGLWNDYPCDWTYPYTCEIWIDRTIELQNKGFDVTSISGRALKYISTKQNWDTAKSACHAWGGYLLTVDSASVTNWVKKTSGVFWIGLNDKATNGQMVWDSGLPFSYKNWHSGSTFDDGGEEDCVGVNIDAGKGGGQWNDYSCDTTFPYTCEVWLNRKIELQSKGFDVATIPGRAVKYFATKKDWDTAKSACHALGGYLLTVDSNTVTNWVKQISDVFWIGLNDKATNGNMVWDSQKSYSYKNWHSGSTFDDGGNEDCVGVNIDAGKGGGQWNDYPCDWSYPYACEIWF